MRRCLIANKNLYNAIEFNMIMAFFFFFACNKGRVARKERGK
jgi:hypothetical protein